MGSIATKTGDRGTTSLIGGQRISKANLRVEAYGTIDELGASLGFARSICEDEQINELVKSIQRELFRVAGSVANPDFDKAPSPYVTPEMLDRLTDQVHRIEQIEGILSDWSLAGEYTPSAAFDLARTVCRRAERCVVRLSESGEKVDPQVIVYLNRLSDLIWLIGRYLELKAGIDSKLRETEGKRWSRAW
ncbi:MAG: cob(I)yrinic acid a,c-diamide adenosyltransferase [Pyrinomonadaceae bacterium]|nr:cob(I)yrinic acid a,c-diamide adenosyltransferase [Pyrinomonadaceae bacterium]MCX7639590.1 cob(I)yrinic acid a,c-diamide adenosyltransferase [Pyrinomonadaceae bacterium]MDW8303983.1 cob(I)yrinic acid a,c-diamide adenosyltransferase [Acidobacteriota bacterium]